MSFSDRPGICLLMDAHLSIIKANVGGGIIMLMYVDSKRDRVCGSMPGVVPFEAPQYASTPRTLHSAAGQSLVEVSFQSE